MGAPWCEWGRARDSTNPIQVTLTRRFRVQQFELTQREWEAEGLPNPSGLMENGTGDCSEPTCPVGNVTWSEALAFANLRSRKAGLPECYKLENCQGTFGSGMNCDSLSAQPAKVVDCTGYRLPTAAEWEYAARAGTRTSVYSGEIVERAPLYRCADDPVLAPIAWYCANAGTTTHPVGGKAPNGYGLHDMIGNAAEWVGSIVEHYTGGPHLDWGATLSVTDHLAETTILQYRGGGFNIWPSALRAAMVLETTGGRGPGVGFRLAQTVSDDDAK